MQILNKTKSKQTSVGQMFDGRSVFVTGASGFIGKVLLEKLLRTYAGIERIYILLRTKKNQSPQNRLHKHIFTSRIFDQIRASEKGEQLFEKVIVIAGDIAEPNLGISEPDMNRILSDRTLSIVFHSAATIKFDEPLKVSVQLNLTATRTIISLCKKLPNLTSFCHVSTAYVNSHIKDQSAIEERIYPIEDEPEHLIKLAQLMDTEMMQSLKVDLVGERPNTYTYTKALAEHLIAVEAADLPVAIVRPSIVVASWKDPIEGWIDNLAGPTGLIVATSKGLMRSLHVNKSCKADMIPVDVTVNTMIAAAFYAAKTNGKLSDKNRQLLPEQKPLIVHCNSGDVNPITWDGMDQTFLSTARMYPSCQVFRYPIGSFKSNFYFDLITRIFVHLLPALLIDSIFRLAGKKGQFLSLYSKLHTALQALSHFLLQNYNFQTKNVRLLESELDESDRCDLFMDIRTLDWNQFLQNYVIGCRRYILKEKDSTLEVARRSLARAYYLEIGLRLLLVLIIISPIAIKFGPQIQQVINSSGSNLNC